MTNRISSHIKQSNNPEDRWDSTEVNKEVTKLDTNISDLSNNLMSTNTVQSVDGQKTFFSLFVDENNGTETYNTTMESLPFNITPVFGAGVYQFGVNRSREEGNYNKKNASGTLMDIAALNPSYMPSEISISYIDSSNIYIKAMNVPLPRTSLTGTYSTSDSNMSAYYWRTSVSIEDSLEITDLAAYTNVKAHNIYLNYIPGTDTTTIDLTSLSTPLNKGVTRCIGVVFSKSSALLKTSQRQGVIYFNEEFSYRELLRMNDAFRENQQYNTNKLFNHCIISFSIPNILTGADLRYQDSSTNSFNTIQNIIPTRSLVKVPCSTNGKSLKEAYSLDARFIQVKSINHGDLLL